MAEGFLSRNFVWYSDRQSITAGKVSLLACAEVVVSVAAYWWLAWYFDTYAHLLVSIVVAPLVLLRSDKSVALGVKMFSEYYDDTSGIPLLSGKGLALVAASGVLALGAGWFVARGLPGHEGWGLFWRSALIGLFALSVGVAVAAAVAFVGEETIAVFVTGAGAGAAAAAVVAAGTMAEAGVEALAIAVAGAVAGAVALAVAAVVALAVEAAQTAAIVVTGSIIGAGVALGVLIRAILTRLLASLRYLAEGVRTLPENWWRSLFLTDLALAPELVPDLAETHDLSFGRWIDGVLSREDVAGRVLRTGMTPILFLPSLLYRYSIKSTCWLYLPLIYLAHVPRKLRDAPGRRIWLKVTPTTLQERARFGMACVTVVIALFAAIKPAALRELLAAAGIGEVPVSVFSLALVLDFSQLHLYPWQYLTLPSAVLTVILFPWLDRLRKEEAAGGNVDVFGLEVSAAIWLDRVRGLLVILWLLVAFYYTVRYMHAGCGLPTWMNRILEWHFDPTCPVDAPDGSVPDSGG